MNFYFRVMFSFLVVVIVICSCFSSHLLAAEVNHGSIDNHYSFTIPDGWTQIPQTAIQEAIMIFSEDSIAKVDYEFGFQKDYQGQYFTYPYLLIQPIDAPPLSKSELLSIVGITPDEYNAIAEDFGKINTNVLDGKPIQDFYLEDKHAAFTSSISNVPGVGEVNALSTVFSGLEGAVAIHYYSTSDDLTSDLIVYSNIIDSFEFDEGYGYQETHKPSREEKVVTGTLSYVFVLIICLVIYTGLKKLLRG